MRNNHFTIDLARLKAKRARYKQKGRLNRMSLNSLDLQIAKQQIELTITRQLKKFEKYPDAMIEILAHVRYFSENFDGQEASRVIDTRKAK